MTKARITHRALGMAAATLLLAGVAPSALASFILGIDDPTTAPFDVIIIDNQGAGALSSGGSVTSNTPDAVPQLGVVNFNVGIAGSVWTVNVTTGVSKPNIGPSRIDLNSVNVSGGTGTLNLFLTDTDFGPTPGTKYALEFGGTTDGTVSATATGDAANGEFGLGATQINVGPLGPGAFSVNQGGGLIGPTALFSLSTLVSITHAGAGDITSFDILVTTVPEPASLGLLGFGLLGLGWAARRRLHKA